MASYPGEYIVVLRYHIWERTILSLSFFQYIKKLSFLCNLQLSSFDLIYFCKYYFINRHRNVLCSWHNNAWCVLCNKWFWEAEFLFSGFTLCFRKKLTRFCCWNENWKRLKGLEKRRNPGESVSRAAQWKFQLVPDKQTSCYFMWCWWWFLSE